MPKIRLELGAELDTLNRAELDDVMRSYAGFWREAAFGLKHMDLPPMQGTIAGGAVTIGGTTVAEGAILGPRSGFAWKVERLSVGGLTTTTDFLTIWKGDQNPKLYVSTIGTGAYHPSKGLILRPGQYLTLTGASLVSTGTLTVTGEIIEAPAVLTWKLID